MGTKLQASLVFVNIPSDKPEASSSFYQTLLGIDLARSLSHEESYHAPISDDGIDLNVNVRHAPQEGPTAFFAVPSLERALRAAQEAGGQVVWGPEDVRMPEQDFERYRAGLKEVEGTEAESPSMGQAAILTDPGGSHVGVIELAKHTHRHFAVGEHQRALNDHQDKVHRKAMELARHRS